jgi:hypothetical protein
MKFNKTTHMFEDDPATKPHFVGDTPTAIGNIISLNFSLGR